jgi:hypothetical protein
MRKASKKTFTFTLLLQGANPLESKNLAALYEAGCDDAVFGRRDAVFYADFDRKATSLAEAVGNAIRDVEGAVKGLRVVRVEPEELVSASAIAERIGRSRESVRLLIDGKRGPGSFPPPAVWVSPKRKLWQWSDAAEWFMTYLSEPPSTAEDASFIAAVNGALNVRRHAAHLSRSRERKEVVRLITGDAQTLSA